MQVQKTDIDQLNAMLTVTVEPVDYQDKVAQQLKDIRRKANIPGFRPAGIYSAGTAQRLINVEGVMPGHEVVILGSGDIGLIMARRLTLEGAHVKLVAELMPKSGGLQRNIVQCLEDFDIPLKLRYTVTEIHGKERLACVQALKNVKVTAPVEIGDVIVHDIVHTGVAVVATKKIRVNATKKYLYKEL